MENQSVEILSTLLKMDKEVLTEKLGTEEGVGEITKQVSELKVYTPTEFTSVTDNLRQMSKDAIYKEVKGATLEMQEKALKAKYEGVKELNRGTDYNTLEELVAIIATNAGANASNDEELKGQIAELQKLNGTNNTDWEQKMKDLIASHNGELVSTSLQSEVSKLRSLVDVDEDIVDGHLQLFKSLMTSKYTVQRDENKNFIVLDEKGQKMVDDTFKNLTLADVVKREATNFFKFKTVTPRSGRGSEQQNQPASGKTNWAKHNNDFDAFLNSEEGKGIQMGSLEGQKLFAEFQEATSSN